MQYARTVKTSSGANAVQVLYSAQRGSRYIEHFGSAHDEVELELLKALPGSGRLPVWSSQCTSILGTVEEAKESADPSKAGGLIARHFE